MRSLRCAAALLSLVAVSTGEAESEGQTLLKTNCAACHQDEQPKGDFPLRKLAESPNADNVELWRKSLSYVRADYMPPAAASRLSSADRKTLIAFLGEQIRAYERLSGEAKPLLSRRLNNREIANSVSDVLRIEDVGTHQPTANLLADTLVAGFDTNGAALGMSQFHLEQYIEAFRKIVDATILSGDRPPTRLYDVQAPQMRMTSLSQNKRNERANRTPHSIEFLDPRLRVYFSNFQAAPATGRYRIRIRAAGIDRGIYDSEETGIYHDDPIRLSVHLGDRVKTFDLPDGTAAEIELDEWIAEGTRLELSYPTDGLRLRNNGNFKFQFSIAHDYIKKNDPELYLAVLNDRLPKAPARTAQNPSHWSHWTGQWQGPRPRLFSAKIEGPLYESWPPRRQVALLGNNPRIEAAAEILRPIAERAWRRAVRPGELDPIVRLVESRKATLSPTEALKEGVVAILASPSFLLLNSGDIDSSDRFAAKLSYFLGSTIPDDDLRASARDGKLQSFENVRAEVQRRLDQSKAEEFLREFPHSWLELDRINFMAPDPDRFPIYSRKRLSEDMINEALQFFRYAVENNLPTPELLSADYTFLNADLARVYGVEGVPRDSTLRKYTFADGKRGGLLGMGAFLTLTADSLSTSPIHRAVYVLEKFMGIRPPPPPDGVKVAEPDVRQAKTIREVLEAHKADPSCASCHVSIDPYGYAFENFNPIGAWRDEYTAQIAPKPSRRKLAEIRRQDVERAAQGLPPLPKPWLNKPLPVDPSSRFPSGTEYEDIVGFRNQMLTVENQERFVRCLISKLLTYANGEEPEQNSEVETILSISAEHDYRIVDTIAAVIHSPLFREE